MSEFVESKALWQWNTTGPQPIATGYPTAGGDFGPTKSGLLPADLKAFVGVPIQQYANPPVPVSDDTILQWIRWAEDKIEQESSVLLCQTWIASPPALTPYDCSQLKIIPATDVGYQLLGSDYDLFDAAYDFMIQNSLDEGWTIQQTRYRPLQSVSYTPDNYTALKKLAYKYPLLNTYFSPSINWFVEDHDAGLVRLVPAGNIAMLPIFQLQLTALAFADDIPGAMWWQYTAGLTPYDYKSRWSFVQQLVLCYAGIQALRSIQGTINLGMKGIQTTVDGLSQKFDYDIAGPFNGMIKTWTEQAADLMNTLKTKVGNFMMTVL